MFAAGASSGGAVNLQQATMAAVEHRKINDLLRVWEERIQKQAQHFESYSTQVLQVDTEIIANFGKIRALRGEHMVLKTRQEAVDQSIQQIWDQQDSLGRLLVGLQEALSQKQPADARDSSRTHQKAKGLSVQLDELDRQVEELSKETTAVQAALYSEPLTTVVRVLDAHANALDAIQQQVDSTSARLSAIEATF